jgi:hypothetical protein
MDKSSYLSKSDFIENGAKAGYFQWLSSKGTNYTCYEQYASGLSKIDIYNNKIEDIRIVIYALQRPFTFMYFFWTILVFVIHKFNFRKPIMRLILYHFLLRSLGNVIDKLGELFRFYYTNEILYEGDVILKSRCKTNEMHPLKWLLTRQVCSILWYVGEIIGDWYPLLRTHAVVRNNKSIWIVYITCAIFNFSKVALIILHLSLSAGRLYNKDGALDNKKMDVFYSNYFIIQLVIIYTSFFYDVAVYIVLKRAMFHKDQYRMGFLKKFKSLSEYRMLISAFVSAIFLPIISFTYIAKYYFENHENMHGLNFDFDETRKMVTSVQYYMIFIDQILLTRYRNESSVTNSNSNSRSNNYSGGNNSSYNKPYLSLSKQQISTTTSDTLRNDTMEIENTFNIGNTNMNNPNYTNNNPKSNYYLNLMGNGNTNNYNYNYNYNNINNNIKYKIKSNPWE